MTLGFDDERKGIIFAPDWFRTPLVQTITLGLVFFSVFAAYTTIQFYAASTYGVILAADTTSAIYFSFTLFCLFAPAITNKLGSQLSMSFGILGYAFLVLCSLVHFLTHNDMTKYLVVSGGFILGCGAALLWTAQGRLMLQYATVADKNSAIRLARTQNDEQHTDNNKDQENMAQLVGIFWAVFQCSSLVGGIISFTYYNTKPQGSTALYLIYLGFILFGAISAQFLLPPNMLLCSEIEVDESSSQERGLKKDFPSSPSFEESTLLAPSCKVDENHHTLNITSTEDKILDDTNHEYLNVEAKETLKLFFTKSMATLFLLFFYTGFNQPYQQATFGNRFFSKRSIGIELIVFHIMEIIGGLYCGRALDNYKSKNNDKHHTILVPTSESYADAKLSNPDRRHSAMRSLILFLIVNTTGNVIAFLEEIQNGKNIKPVDVLSDNFFQSVWPTLAFACWGFADAQIQVYCYWFIGSIFETADEHSRAVGYYKCVQSLGYSIGFYLIPPSRLSPILQLVVSSSIFYIGTCLAFMQLPS